MICLSEQTKRHNCCISGLSDNGSLFVEQTIEHGGCAGFTEWLGSFFKDARACL